MQNTRHTAELRETLGRYLGAYPEEENRLARWWSNLKTLWRIRATDAPSQAMSPPRAS